MKISRLFFIVILSFVIFGCSKQPNEGIVIAKRHEPTTTYPMIIMIPVSTGKTTMLIPVVYMMYDDEDWVVIYQNNDKQYTKYISQEHYNSIAVNDYGVFEEDKNSDTPQRLRKATDDESKDVKQY